MVDKQNNERSSLLPNRIKKLKDIGFSNNNLDIQYTRITLNKHN